MTFRLADWAELNMEMNEGGTIVWSFETLGGEEIYFDLHGHVDGQVENHEEFHASSGETGQFTAPSDGGYSFFLQNLQEDEVRVRLQVRGVFEVESDENIEPVADSNGSPGPPLVLLLAVFAAAANGLRLRPRA